MSIVGCGGDSERDPDETPDSDVAQETDGTTDPDPDGTTDPDPDGTTDPDPDGTTDPDPDGTTDPDPDGTTDPDPDGMTDPDVATDADVAPDVDETPLTWSGRALAGPPQGDWSSSFAADEDAIWVLAGGMMQEFDGSDWTPISSPDLFGFEPPQPGDPPTGFELYFDPVTLGGRSRNEVYIGSANGLLAMYDGSEFTMLSEGFGGAELSNHQLLQGDGRMWASPAGNLYHLANATEYNLVVWDGTERTTASLNTRVISAEYPVRVIWGIDDENVWVGGTVTHPFDSPIHRWNGSEWTRRTETFPDNGHIVGFWGASPDDVWMPVTGSELGSRLYRNTGDGWNVSGTGFPEDDAPYQFTDIWGTSNSNVFVSSNKGLFRYNGTTWSKIDIGVDDPVWRIHGVTATKLIVEVRPSSSSRVFYVVEGL